MNVRWATPRDAGGVAFVHVASWRAAYRGLLPDEALDSLSVEARTLDWEGWLSPGGPRARTLVAEADGDIVGFCTVELPSSEEDEENDVGGVPALYLHPDAFGAGVGRALMDAAMAAMREHGCREAILWMLAGNERAERFYGRLGWKPDGGERRSDYPGITYASDAERPRELRLRRAL